MNVIHFPANGEKKIEYLSPAISVSWSEGLEIMGTKIQYCDRERYVSGFRVNYDSSGEVLLLDLSYNEPGPGMFRFVEAEFD